MWNTSRRNEKRGRQAKPKSPQKRCVRHKKSVMRALPKTHISKAKLKIGMRNIIISRSHQGVAQQKNAFVYNCFKELNVVFSFISQQHHATVDQNVGTEHRHYRHTCVLHKSVGNSCRELQFISLVVEALLHCEGSVRVKLSVMQHTGPSIQRPLRVVGVTLFRKNAHVAWRLQKYPPSKHLSGLGCSGTL